MIRYVSRCIIHHTIRITVHNLFNTYKQLVLHTCTWFLTYNNIFPTHWQTCRWPRLSIIIQESV
jgi:hypothetical protein